MVFNFTDLAGELIKTSMVLNNNCHSIYYESSITVISGIIPTLPG